MTERGRWIRAVPERAPLLQIGTVFGAFLLGPLAGLRLAMLLTPESELVQSLSVFAFAGVLVAGMVLWMGFGIVSVVLSALGRIVPGRVPGRAPGPSSPTAADRIVPPGYRSFVVLGPVLVGPVGVLAGVVSDLSVVAGGLAWGLAGLAYGWALWWAAHGGYLPFPEPE